MAGETVAAGIGVAGGLLGMIGQKARARTQFKRQKKLMGIQHGNQQELNIQGQELGMKTWRDTSYGPQMKMMEEAGLNPALMYGMSGGGGQTTSTPTGGSAQGGQSKAPMDIGAAISSAKIASEIALINAQKEKTVVETTKIGGTDTEESQTRIGKIIAETTNIQAKEALTKIETGIKNIEERYKEAEQSNKITTLIGQAREAEVKGWIAVDTYKDVVEQIKQTAIYAEIKNQAEKAGIELTEERTREIYHSILQKWTQAGLKGLDILVKGRLGDIGRKKTTNPNKNPGQWRKNE